MIRVTEQDALSPAELPPATRCVFASPSPVHPRSSASKHGGLHPPNTGRPMLPPAPQVISVMQAYDDMSLEELRWQDYQAGAPRGPPLFDHAAKLHLLSADGSAWTSKGTGRAIIQRTGEGCSLLFLREGSGGLDLDTPVDERLMSHIQQGRPSVAVVKVPDVGASPPLVSALPGIGSLHRTRAPVDRRGVH